MKRTHDMVETHATGAVQRNRAAHRVRGSAHCTWSHVRRQGVLTAVVVAGLAVASLAACGVDMKERTEVDGDAAAASTESATSPARKGNDRGNTAVLASSSQPGNVTPDSERSASVALDSGVPANVTYGDAERVFRAGDYSGAAELFDAYATRKPENPWGHYMLGISAWRAGDRTRAEAALRRTLKVDPNHTKGLLNLARVLLEQGEASDALEHVERVIDLKPESGEGWRVLGNVRSELGPVEDAVEAYREALVLDQQDAWTMNNLGVLMIRDGRYKEALPPLARATELRPHIAVFQNNLGSALERSGHLAEATEAFRAALDADPDYEKARVSLDRIESRVTAASSLPVDVAELAAAFADDVSQWKKQHVEAAGAENAEPVDTVRASRPGSARE